jgi:hypothetical protein
MPGPAWATPSTVADRATSRASGKAAFSRWRPKKWSGCAWVMKIVFTVPLVFLAFSMSLSTSSLNICASTMAISPLLSMRWALTRNEFSERNDHLLLQCSPLLREQAGGVSAGTRLRVQTTPFFEAETNTAMALNPRSRRGG